MERRKFLLVGWGGLAVGVVFLLLGVVHAQQAPQSPLASDDDAASDEARSSDAEAPAVLKICSKPTPLSFYPVRGKHDTGYQENPEPNKWKWTCNAQKSNPDFRDEGCKNSDSHFGIDIWAKEGTPVVATVAGKVIQAESSKYSGNKVTIRDACGWAHFSIHMKSIAKGIKKGTNVIAGQLIGYVGKTGTASGGTVHLHYSVYPDGTYCEGINPHSRLRKVEKDVCWLPVKCGARVCGKGQVCAPGCRNPD